VGTIVFIFIPHLINKRIYGLCTDQILAELIQVGDKTLYSEIHKLTNSIWNKEELPHQWKESIVLPIYKKK
jgi:hypothetical protein